MNLESRWRTAFCSAFALLLCTPATIMAADDLNQNSDSPQNEVSAPVTPTRFEGDVRELPPRQTWRPGDAIREIPKRSYNRPGAEKMPAYATSFDALAQQQLDFDIDSGSQRLGGDGFIVPSRNFEGLGFTGVNPPDPAGDVGPNHYIQMINGSGGSVVNIYDKAAPTPNLLANFDLDSLGSGECASGRGDPIVIYDWFADRWVLTEFSFSGNELCFYVSQTSDPVTGGWFAYGFAMPSFPDYPKYGVWPTDANNGQGSYVVTANESSPSIIAMDRGNMLNGTAATFQRTTISDLSGFNFQTATAADIDGFIAPPAGAGAIIMRHRDTENHSGITLNGADLLEQWQYDVDWVTPANTALAQVTSIEIAEIDSALCGLTAFACFPQQGSGTTLDPLREVIMNRLVYRNFGDYEMLFGNLVTDVDGADLGGLRWFELRRTPGATDWSLFQEGTYAPDTDSRWMAASAMDQSGNVAIAYNISSSSRFPGLAYTGRLADDPLGVMSQPETNIFLGSGANSSNRYGDYSAMNLDPEDECTFWFTGESNPSSSWSTQITTFGFDACGCDLPPLPLTPTVNTGGDNEIDLTWDDSELPSVVEYLVRRSRTSGGPYETIATLPDSSPGSGNGAGYAYTDSTVSGGLTYFYAVVASDGSACKSDLVEGSATATGTCTLAPLFSGGGSATSPFTNQCALDVIWPSGSPECAGPLTYNVYRSSSPGFTPGLDNRVATGVAGNSFTDNNQLTSGQAYYYIVRAVDTSNGVEESNSVEFSGFPLGEVTTGTFRDDAGDTGAPQMMLSGPWSIDGTEGNDGPNVYKTGQYGDNTCAAITSPELLIGATSQLSFSSQYDIEASWDKGEVQISTDGVNWQRLEVGYPGNSTNTSDNCGLPTGTFFTGQPGLSWADYSVDLSGFAGQFARVRFLMSSDTSQIRDGWWIDDIEITNVDVPGACSTGSSCLDNPFVDVEPEAPGDVCVLSIPELSANLSGGTGPFLYQWTKDGVDIPGATSATYQPTDVGTFAYNARVRSDSCEDQVSDGQAVNFTVHDRPSFGGIQSVVDPQTSTCSLDLSWGSASSFCPGPLEYFVYRDTTPNVATTPENLIAAGLATTSFSDDGGIVQDAPYFYKVLALDQSLNVFADDSGIELSASATGPGSGVQTVFDEDFEAAGAFSAWSVGTGPGPHRCGEFAISTSGTQRPSGGAGSYARALSQSCQPLLPLTSTFADSPAIDLNLPGTVNSLTLEFDLFFEENGGEAATVELWNGSSWQVIWSDSDSTFNGNLSFDILSYLGIADFQIRFNYQTANNDRWMSFDNVRIISDISSSCLSVSGPSSAPDGSGATTPLLADKLDPLAANLSVTWDATTCTATDYNLIYGSLASVASYSLTGSSCSLGTGGVFNWSGAPAGDLYYLIVGTDGAGTESSWGYGVGGGERNGTSDSGTCGVSNKETSNVCF